MFDEDRHKDFEDGDSGFDKLIKKYESGDDKEIGFTKVAEASTANVKALTEKNILDIEDDNVIFKDFTEPDVLKTGYLIPLSCGHNGQLSINEKTIYEIHLTNAGFIQESASAHASAVSGEGAHRSSLDDDDS